MKSLLVILIVTFLFVLKASAQENKPGENSKILATFFDDAKKKLSQDKMNEAQEACFSAIRYAKSKKDAALLVEAYLKTSDIFYEIGDTPGTIRIINQALLVPRGLQVEQKIDCYNKLGILNSYFKEHRKSIEAYKKGIDLIPEAQKKSGKTYEWFYNNIALSYMEMGKLDSAQYYHQECLKIRLKKHNDFELGQTYNNLGSLFFAKKMYDSALVNFTRGLTLRKSTKGAPESSIIESEINIGKTLIQLGRLNEAEKTLLKNRKPAKKLKNSSLDFRLTEQLAKLYEAKKEHQNAYKFLKEFMAIKDSMFAIDKREEIIRSNLSFKYEEQKQKDSIINHQKISLLQEKEAKEKELNKQKDREKKIIITFFVLAMVLFLGVIILIYRNYRTKKKTAEEILIQKNEAEQQRNKVQLIHNELRDSILYAKRIQSAILPPKKAIEATFSDGFVFYQPKDIIAGDFYWFEQFQGKIFIAVADCTGHGVPGALVSIVCHNALNRSVKEFNLTNPAAILDKTREIVVSEFGKSDEEVNDGMDISLAVLDRTQQTLFWAGAHNPLWLIRRGELHEYKADKQPIGKYAHAQPFSSTELHLETNDLLYLFTDGFQDQFGGEREKKYRAVQLKEKLLEIHHYPMEEQAKFLSTEFDEWKGALEQVDDVCIIGLKITPNHS